MSQGKKVSPLVQIISAGTMTGTTVITSSTFDVSGLDNIGILLKWTGTPNGTFQIKGAMDGINFEDLKPIAVDGSALSAAGSASQHSVSLNQFPGKSIQVVYTNSSSTGTLNAWAYAKGF